MKVTTWERRVEHVVESTMPTCKVCGAAFERLRKNQVTDRPSCAKALEEKRYGQTAGNLLDGLGERP
jgi:hypothetical protein